MFLHEKKLVMQQNLMKQIPEEKPSEEKSSEETSSELRIEPSLALR